ncbi:hypothetical protein VNO77_42199 [Canavalia gladiata]|uniref:Semialdehyde dehydrogenase NAD-binding domain-containing protein n=1 Tax=Canavalia gladiata TaxID=3824 RepID=A0AAN9K077_CANGL
MYFRISVKRIKHNVILHIIMFSLVVALLGMFVILLFRQFNSLNGNRELSCTASDDDTYQSKLEAEIIYGNYPILQLSLVLGKDITITLFNDLSDVDAVFCCLPHGTTQDFRLRDISEYEEWYGQPHRAPDLQKEAIYGLTEVLREEIKNASLVANPGCYPTSIQLPLVPLIKVFALPYSFQFMVHCAKRDAPSVDFLANQFMACLRESLIKSAFLDRSTQDAKSRVVFGMEMAPGVRIEELYQQLKLSYEVYPFMPSLVTSSHIDAVITICIYADITKNADPKLDEELFVVLENGVIPRTHNVKGTNYCLINVFPDRIPGRGIIISVIDN